MKKDQLRAGIDPGDAEASVLMRIFLMGEERQRGNCRNTLATKTARLRSFFGWCEREDLIDKDPISFE